MHRRKGWGVFALFGLLPILTVLLAAHGLGRGGATTTFMGVPFIY